MGKYKKLRIQSAGRIYWHLVGRYSVSHSLPNPEFL